MGHPAFPHLQRSTASCHRSRSQTAQPTMSPPATTWWTSACRPPPTDRNPTSCSAARTCERPAPRPRARARARPRPPPAPPRTALRSPAPPSPPLPSSSAWLAAAPEEQESSSGNCCPRSRKARRPARRACSWVPVCISAGQGGWQAARGRPEARRRGAPSGLLQFSTADSRERRPPSVCGQLAPLTPLPPKAPPRTPFRAAARRARRLGAGAGGHSGLPAPLPPHAQPAPHTPSTSPVRARPAPACRFVLGEDPDPPSPSFCTQRALQPLPGPLSVLSPVWSGTCLQVKQYLRVLYIQPLL